MKTKIQITLRDINKIIELAENKRKLDNSLSDTIEIILIENCDTHCGTDKIEVNIKNGFSECWGKKLYTNK